MNKIVCPLCGESMKRITHKHCMYRHNITLQDLRDRFPGLVTISEESKERTATKTRDQWKDECHRSHVSEVNSSRTKEQWKNPEFRDMHSEKSRERLKALWEDPRYREIFTESVRKSWDNESTVEKRVSKGWSLFHYLDAHGRSVRLKSSYELLFAFICDYRGITWDYEPCRFPCTLYGKRSWYVPDFRIGEIFVEIKGWFPEYAQLKILDCLRSPPELKLVIFRLEDLLEFSQVDLDLVSGVPNDITYDELLNVYERRIV